MKCKDEIGNRYGRLLVTERLENVGSAAVWKCLCDCGNTKQILGITLRQGRRSCGCDVKDRLKKLSNNRLMDLIGNSYGKLVVICRHEASIGQGNSRWICRCACGSEKVVIGKNLRTGATTSCGCARSEKLCEMYADRRLPELERKSRVNARARIVNRKAVAEIRDHYVRKRLDLRDRLRINSPQDLLDLKREHLRLVRELRK